MEINHFHNDPLYCYKYAHLNLYEIDKVFI